ncbi:MAG: histidine phosphatase family protein [Cytophagaceae bacterium]|nr:histidine phosphatase family protein [Gemmatimonadaceae bacterium]
MAGLIVLGRHGPSSCIVGGRHTRDGVMQSRVDYDVAGVRSSSRPPEELRRLATVADAIVSSDLRRAVEAAGCLAGERPVTSCSLLREIPLDIPRVQGRLPIGLWEVLIHLKWAYDIARGQDLALAEQLRVQAAADWLVAQAADSNTLGVTHGVMRRALSRQLTTLGWRRQRVLGGHRPWSAWFFEAAETRVSPAPPR